MGADTLNQSRHVLVGKPGSIVPQHAIVVACPGYLLNDARSAKVMIIWGGLGQCKSEFPGVHWNRPEGGFFMTVQVPFEFTMSLVEECAATAGAIVTPMSAHSDDRDHRFRRIATTRSDRSRPV